MKYFNGIHALDRKAHYLSKVVTILRALHLKQSSAGKWKKLQELESHEEGRRKNGRDVWFIAFEFCMHIGDALILNELNFMGYLQKRNFSKVQAVFCFCLHCTMYFTWQPLSMDCRRFLNILNALKCFRYDKDVATMLRVIREFLKIPETVFSTQVM